MVPDSKGPVVMEGLDGGSQGQRSRCGHLGVFYSVLAWSGRFLVTKHWNLPFAVLAGSTQV